MSKIENDKYYTESVLAQKCVETTYNIIGDKWERVIEPSVGDGAFLPYLPNDTLYFDIAPSEKLPNTTQADFREIDLPYIQDSLVIGNPPFGRANKLSVQFIKKAMTLGDYCSFIQPISQLNQNRTMKDTELLYSEDLGNMNYSGKKVHCCLNIYHKKKNGHKQDYSVPGIDICRHIFRSGKYKHDDSLLNYPWDFRVGAWGNIHLLEENEKVPNEVVFKVQDNMKDWVKKKLEKCDYNGIVSCVASPNLPAWRLMKWLKEQYQTDFES